MKNLVAKARLKHDMEEILKTPGFELLNLTAEDINDEKNQPIVCWNMNIRGAENSYWHNQIYDFQMLFDKHFPFEPPRLHFPSTVLNKKSIKHQLVGRNGNLDLNCVSKDQWTCASTVVDIIREVQTLFRTDPLYSISDVADSFLFELPEEPMFGLIAYLSLGDILRLSSVCKKALLILHSNDLWAKIYYTRCQVPAAVLYNTGAALLHAGPGPLREFTAMSKSFQWRHSREAFVRAHQCNRVLRHYKVPSLQSLAAGELSVLLPLAYPAEMAAARALPWTDDNDDEEARMSTKQPQPAGQKRAPSDHHGLDEQINWLGGAPTYSSLAEIQAQEFMSQVMPPFDYPHNLLHHPHHHHHHFMQQQHQQHQQQHGHVNATLPPGTNVGYFAALKYRALRSCRLAQWLGGSNCITANLVHNYWNNLPVTFLQFLCSLSVSMGQQGTPRVELAQRLSVEATLSVRECHQHMRYTEQRYQQLTTGTMSTNGTIGGIIIDTIDATDITATAEGTGAAVATTAGDPSSSIGDDLNADAEQIAEFGVPNAKLFAEGLPTPAPPFPGRSSGSSSAPVSVHEVFGGSAVDTRVLRSRDPAVRARLELVQDLVRNNGARSASVRENCDNFESIRTALHEEKVYGPDLYDLIERLHEVNIAFSYQFRDLPANTRLDCLDQNSDWVEAKVLNRSKAVLPSTTLTNVFSLESKPTDEQVLLRVCYLLSEIKLRDHRHFAALARSHQLNNLLQMNTSAGWGGGAAAVARFDAGHLSQSQRSWPVGEAADTEALKVTKMADSHRSNHIRTWICFTCTSLNHSTDKVCNTCSSGNFYPLYLRTAIPDFSDTVWQKNRCIAEASAGSCAGAIKSEEQEEYEEEEARQRLEELQQMYEPVSTSSTSSSTPAFDEEDFLNFTLLVLPPGGNIAVTSSHFFISQATTELQLRMRALFIQRFPPNFHELSSKEQRNLYLQWRYLQPPDSHSSSAPPMQPAAETAVGTAVGTAAGMVTSSAAVQASAPPPGAPTAPTASAVNTAHPPALLTSAAPIRPWRENAQGIALAERLRQSLSPYFAFNGQQAAHFMRQFCAMLEEEQGSEFRTAAAFRMARQVLSERPALPPCLASPEVQTYLCDKLGSFPSAVATGMAVNQLFAGAVPVTTPWPVARPPVDTFGLSFWVDVQNSILRHCGIHGTAFSPEQVLCAKQYDGFNLARSLHLLSSITAHFSGYDSRFDERVSVLSARLAPYRTHTSRTQSLSMNTVGELLMRVQDQARGVVRARHSQSVANQFYPFDLPGNGARANQHTRTRRRQQEEISALSLVDSSESASSDVMSEYLAVPSSAPASVEGTPRSGEGVKPSASTGSLCAESSKSTPKDTVLEIKLRCLWLCSKPGGGIVSYRLPASMKLRTVVRDCCDVLGLNFAQVQAGQLDMIQCVRYAYERRIHSSLRSGEWGEDAAASATGAMPGVHLLELSSTLEELSIASNSLVDIIYRPLREECYA